MESGHRDTLRHTRLDGCDGIHLDVTGNCNLRCPYCVNDFTQVHGNILMDKAVFEKVTSLFPLIRPGGSLLFSCYFEPTLHGAFLDLLSGVPPGYRARGGFTTNLGRKLARDFFERLAELGLGFVNVSLDSLRAEVFEQMRKGSHFSVFMRNLEGLTEALGKSSAGTKLQFISVASKLNLEEIPDLVAACSRIYSPSRHEVRVIWLTKEMEARQWVREQILSVEELIALRTRLAGSPPHVEVVSDLPPNPQAFSPFPFCSRASDRNLVEQAEDPETRRVCTVPPVPILQINSDGILRFLVAEPDFALDLKGMGDPESVIRQVLVLQNLNFERATRLRQAMAAQAGLKRVTWLERRLAEGKLRLEDVPAASLGHMDLVSRLADGAGVPRARWYRVSGWARSLNGEGPAKTVILTAGKGRKRRVVAVATPELERTDVVLALRNTSLLHSGWACEVDLADTGRDATGDPVIEAYVPDETGFVAYRLEGQSEALVGEGRGPER